MGGHGRQNNVVISHLVDPDSRLFDARSSFVNKKFGNTPECVQDVREDIGKQGSGCHIHIHPTTGTA